MSLAPSRTAAGLRVAAAGTLRVALYNEFTLVAAHEARALMAGSRRLDVQILQFGSAITQPLDVVLLDPTTLPEHHRWAQVRELARHPHVGMVVLYAGYLSEEWRETGRRNGARAHVLKSLSSRQLAAELTRLMCEPRVTKAPRGSRTWPGREEGLSLREADVLALIVNGKSNDEVARALGVSINTVKTYIRTAYRKAGVSTRSQAVRWAIEHGVSEHQPPVLG